MDDNEAVTSKSTLLFGWRDCYCIVGLVFSFSFRCRRCRMASPTVVLVKSGNQWRNIVTVICSSLDDDDGPQLQLQIPVQIPRAVVQSVAPSIVRCAWYFTMIKFGASVQRRHIYHVSLSTHNEDRAREEETGDWCRVNKCCVDRSLRLLPHQRCADRNRSAPSRFNRAEHTCNKQQYRYITEE